ncbi:MAG TPA: CBS domain-containing protein [Polyangiaceae bacterium]|nr:CBS domain-containing protein [Polyangiaceae bacterium]
MRVDANLRVRDIMTTELLTVEQNQSLIAADDLMARGRVRHALVVDEDGALAGVVSHRDLFHSGLLKALGYGTHAKHKVLEDLRVKDAMTAQLVTTTPDAALRDAARLMASAKIGCLPVVEAGRLVGIITEGDFVLLVADDAGS